MAKRNQLVVLLFRDYHTVLSSRLAQSETPIAGKTGIFLFQNSRKKNFKAVVKCITR
jgi:hypothetical protein